MKYLMQEFIQMFYQIKWMNLIMGDFLRAQIFNIILSIDVLTINEPELHMGWLEVAQKPLGEP